MRPTQIRDITMNKFIKIIKSPAIGLLSLSITLIALIFALLQTYQAKTIIDSISTRYVGEFPATMGQINKLLLDATESIVIFEDVLGYGMFSEPDEFHKYLTILDKKSADGKLKLEIVIYNNDVNLRTTKMQFVGSKYIEKFRSLRNEKDSAKTIEEREIVINKMVVFRDSIFTEYLKENKKKWEYFLNYDFSNEKGQEGKNGYTQLDKSKNIFKDRDVESIKFLEFYDMLVDFDKKIETILTAGGGRSNVKIETVGIMHTMNCWLTKGKDTKAIFGFTRGFGSSEIAFTTIDPQLIAHINSLKISMKLLKDDPYGKYVDDENTNPSILKLLKKSE